MSEIHNARTAPLRAVNTSGFVPSFTLARWSVLYVLQCGRYVLMFPRLFKQTWYSYCALRCAGSLHGMYKINSNKQAGFHL
jgi:hypothetical protein